MLDKRLWFSRVRSINIIERPVYRQSKDLSTPRLPLAAHLPVLSPLNCAPPFEASVTSDSSRLTARIMRQAWWPCNRRIGVYHGGRESPHLFTAHQQTLTEIGTPDKEYCRRRRGSLRIFNIKPAYNDSIASCESPLCRLAKEELKRSRCHEYAPMPHQRMWQQRQPGRPSSKRAMKRAMPCCEHVAKSLVSGFP